MAEKFDILQALSAITREKNIDRDIVIESLEAGLQSAAKRKFGNEAIIEAKIDQENGTMTVEQILNVVDEIEDEEAEITLKDAKAEYGSDVGVGDQIRIDLPLSDFGRNAILVAKQIIVQKVREAERSRIFDEYKDKVDTIVTGTIQQVDRGNILINLDRVEALLPWREQIRGEKHMQGRSVRAFVIEALDNAKGPQVILSRAHPLFLKALFDQEVPEIQEGIVEIKAVAREPGSRSKIAVTSSDDRVDAVGSCVGMRGSRVQAVTRELAGERVDIVSWSADPSALISRALSPAEVSQIVLRESLNEATVVVSDDQLSKAIGKEGKNVRLAAKLTGWKIDLISVREHSVRQLVRQEVALEIDDMTGVSEKIAASLRGAGLMTIEDVAGATISALLEIDGVGEKTAQTLHDTSLATLDELNRIMETRISEELEKVKEEHNALFDDESFTRAEHATVQPDFDDPASEITKSPFAGFDEKIAEEDSDVSEDSEDSNDSKDSNDD
ncbi:transcription termination factor NusA [bacterium]|jgi:N utilization substance protein A|nr:transcription termination factor NusA [bacterium]MBT4291134.1 transcription termination factor NusA [bacterium]MBT7311570.1 transcription termination factor NusA [bacterium]